MSEHKMPTIHDVAKEANVSIATVSNVLNNKKRASKKTTQLVLETIKRLGYSPNEVARSLKVGSNKLIGVIAPDNNPFFSEILRGVQDECQKYDWQVVIANSEESESKQNDLLKTLASHQVGGIILAPVKAKLNEFDEVLDRVPIVLIDREISEIELACVKVDNVQGSKLATSHLIQHGHERIGIILASPGISTTVQRREGYIQAIQNHNKTVDETLIEYGGNYTGTQSQINGGYLSTIKLMSRPERPTAIVATNHLLSIGTLKALKELKIRIPDDVAIIGFDDHPWQEIITPPLTVVSQPAYDMGIMAVKMLEFQKPNEKKHTVSLPLKLVIRESCGCSLEHINNDNYTLANENVSG